MRKVNKKPPYISGGDSLTREEAIKRFDLLVWALENANFYSKSVNDLTKKIAKDFKETRVGFLHDETN